VADLTEGGALVLPLNLDLPLDLPLNLLQVHAAIARREWDASSKGSTNASARTMAILGITQGNVGSMEVHGVDPSAPRFQWLPAVVADARHMHAVQKLVKE
jgi:hypothetical protein